MLADNNLRPKMQVQNFEHFKSLRLFFITDPWDDIQTKLCYITAYCIFLAMDPLQIESEEI
jgi:hypothetical protein